MAKLSERELQIIHKWIEVRKEFILKNAYEIRKMNKEILANSLKSSLKYLQTVRDTAIKWTSYFSQVKIIYVK